MNINAATSVSEPVFPGTDPLKTQAVGAVKTAPEPAKKEVADEKKVKPVTPLEQLQEMADTLNDYMDELQTNLGFFINKKLTNPIIVEIKNRKTDELIKQIPSEELVKIREKMAELTGLLLDRSV